MKNKKKYQHFFDENKNTWNLKTKEHTKSEFYNVEQFKKGTCSLNSFELSELGDVAGKSLLHLQCHFGLDTLSWSRRGAVCTGIDFSGEAIKFAKNLANELKLKTNFIECNVYDVQEKVEGLFDIVFTSYGVIGWLPDLTAWAKIISQKLKVGGVFYMVEFHPIVWMFDYLKTPPKLTYPYKSDQVIYEEYEGTYANTNARITSKEYGWNHGLGNVVTALSSVGLQIEFLHEHSNSPYNCLPDLMEKESGMFGLQPKNDLYPLLFSIKAVKK